MLLVVSFVEVILAQARDVDSVFFCSFYKLLIGKVGVNAQKEVKSRVLLGYGHPFIEGVAFYRLHQLVTSGTVEVAHTVDVLFKVALFYKRGEGVLFKIRDGAGVEAESLVILFHKCLGEHHIAYTDCWGKGLREGVDVDDLFEHVNALQWGDRLAQKTEFAVVIVLDDVAVR